MKVINSYAKGFLEANKLKEKLCKSSVCHIFLANLWFVFYKKSGNWHKSQNFIFLLHLILTVQTEPHVDRNTCCRWLDVECELQTFVVEL